MTWSQLIFYTVLQNQVSLKNPESLNYSDRKLVGSKSLLILVSDFLMDIGQIIEAIHLLGDHEVKIIQVLDPIEKNLAMQGDFKLIDSENKQMLRTYISPRLRVKYQQMLDDNCAKIEEICNRLGFHYFLITTDTPIFDAFYRVLEQKARNVSDYAFYRGLEQLNPTLFSKICVHGNNRKSH